ncbi:MAG: FAD-dependent oxidoreductase, partial [Thermomicrobiales bacterium]
MIDSADVVVIGSGAFGASVAFHLIERGVSNVALVDQHAIGSQTSAKAAGNAAQARGHHLMVSHCSVQSRTPKGCSSSPVVALADSRSLQVSARCSPAGSLKADRRSTSRRWRRTGSETAGTTSGLRT